MSQPRLPYYAAPSGLRDRVQAAVRRPPARPSAPWRPAAWTTGVAAALVLLASGAWLLGAQRRAADAELTSVLDGHLRSLAPGHLADVASTDQHTVKPWFAGKLDFSPPVADPAADGFPLVGARVDVLDGRNVAALVYSRRSHIINVFVRPLGADERATSRNGERRGYNLVRWAGGGMRFWAVSDLNVQELAQLRNLLVAGTVGPGGSTAPSR
jgi:anti-sigma factor RsiW